jgi:hypothetical protein
MPIFSLLAAMILVIAHLFAGRLRFPGAFQRSSWLSLAGGVSVAYVFLRLLPELGAGQEIVGNSLASSEFLYESHIYLVSLLGLVTFYGLERMAITARKRQSGEEGGASDLHFWVHIISFGFYNILIGYLVIHQEDPGPFSLLLFTFAMGLHFFVTDSSLREHHQDDYDNAARYYLSGSVLIGWLVGYLIQVSDLVIAVLTAFLAGAIILNVLKEELPEERKSRFLPFLLGVSMYSAVLLIV